MPRAFVSYTYRDAKDAIATNQISFPANVDIAVLSTFARETAQLIDTLTRCQIIGIGIGLEIQLSSATGIKTAPIAGSDVEEGARFQWSTSSDTLTSFRIPAFDEAFVDSQSRNVDTANTDVDALVQRILAGKTQGLINVSPSDQLGNDVTALYSARESFQKSRA